MENGKTNATSLSIALSFIIWGLLFCIFPHWTGMITWVAWIFYVIGFLWLLLGTMGACIEWGKEALRPYEPEEEKDAQ